MAGLLLLFDGHLKHGPAKLARGRRHRHCFIRRNPPCASSIVIAPHRSISGTMHAGYA